MNDRALPPHADAGIAPVLLTSVENGVARLTMNRPRQFNAISMEMLVALQSALDDIAANREVRVVVIAGSGPAFSGGHDLKEMMANRHESFIGELFERCSRVMLAMQALPQPVIARVHGVATAAGCQIVAACDLAVASTDARFATSGINFGLFCATPGVPVSRNVSRKRAFEMLFTGEFIDAATAQDWGLVNSVVPPQELDREDHGRRLTNDRAPDPTPWLAPQNSTSASSSRSWRHAWRARPPRRSRARGSAFPAAVSSG